VSAVTTSIFGNAVLRSEDPRFLRGEGRYVENHVVPGALRACFVRSIFPHARVEGVDVGTARSMPGVVAVYVADDLGLAALPPAGTVETGTSDQQLEGAWLREVLARDVVRYVGEPIAVVVAETTDQAADAAETVLVDYEPLDAVTDPEAAVADGAPLLWPEFGTNVCSSFQRRWDEDALAGAEVVVSARVVNQRLAPVPMEANAICVEPASDGTVTVWVSTQVPFDIRSEVAEILGLERKQVRAIAPDVGGGFGTKGAVYPEYLVVAKAALLLRRPVRWFETRSESMLSLNHGRAFVSRLEIGATRDGKVTGLRVEIIGDMGAYPVAAFLPPGSAHMLSGCYAIPTISYRGRCVVTNTTPIGAYRGAGRPEAAETIERAMDLLADELGLDPAEIRRRNFIPPDAFPFTTAAGGGGDYVYDTGEYAKTLDEALKLAGYESLSVEQAERRARGDHLALGIGLATYVEVTSFSSQEYGSVEVHDDGSVTVLTGTSPHGQGHETAFAQIASGVLGVAFEDVRVLHSDTGVVPSGQGTWGSRSLQAGGSAVFEQAQIVLERGRRIAAHLLEVDPADVEEADGGFAVRGAPDRAVDWSAVATAANGGGALPEALDTGTLRSEGKYREPGSTFPFGAHVAVVEVDLETGEVRQLSHVAVDDCGTILNPMLVQGQQHGGIGQGIAQALYEWVTYDEAGNPLTANLTSYLMPSAADMPPIITSTTETTTDRNPLGAKGIGEAGSVGSTPAVHNAVVDALSHLGVRHVDLPLSPERVWEAIRRAREGKGFPDLRDS
jgi:carbon-monoxide dehydrogenase large subunit